MGEVWKDIADYSNYQISNFGRVRNKKRGSLVVTSESKTGYMHVGLYQQGGARKNVYVHRLVADAFLVKKSECDEVNHLDGNKTNNHVDNLEWCTRSENTIHAFKTGLKTPPISPKAVKVKILETGEEFDSIRECARSIGGDRKSIHSCLNGGQKTHHDLHFEVTKPDKKSPEALLYDYQFDAVERLSNGSILCGGVGSGKSRTALAYYCKEHGGDIYSTERTHPKMKNPRDLYIITTARKRDTFEWEDELSRFLLTTNPETALYKHTVVIDSWNNIKKYKDVVGAFFIFDEQRVVGSGAWVKAFLNIARKNKWILLSATPGDTWQDYIPVFVANGFYKNKTEFIREHVIYSRFTKYPKIDRYINTGRLIQLRDQILVDMDFKRETIPHNEPVWVGYDISKYKEVGRSRWNPYTDAPIVNASELCYTWRKIVNSDESRQVALLELFEKHPKMIVFYNFDYELDILKGLYYGDKVEIAEWNGHKHQPIPEGKSWVYLVQYTAGAEGWNCIKTDTIVFYSQNYSYKVMQQAAGRIDRLNTPFRELWYYHLKTRSGIDLAISRALKEKKKFNERAYVKW